MKAPLTSIVFLVSCVSPGFADKDSQSYGSYSNPNVVYPHYWADAPNVLQDLSSFKQLYVQYYGCAWSEQTYSSQNQEDNQNKDRRLHSNDNNDNAASYCGQEGGGGDNSWYMGMGKCMGSNVAYALYGVLPSDKLGRKESPCSKKTFINSFFTTDGLTSFVSATTVNANSLKQNCAWYDNNKAYTTTVGCSATGHFTTDTFVGAGCFGYNFNETVDELETLNESLLSTGCKLIYTSDGSDDASSLLSYSQVCTIDGINKNFCPNPHKMLSIYEYNFAMAQQQSNYTVTKTSFAASEQHVDIAKVAASFTFFAAGLGLFAGSAWQLLSMRQSDKKVASYAESERSYSMLA